MRMPNTFWAEELHAHVVSLRHPNYHSGIVLKCLEYSGLKVRL